ncbi:MAG: hypothetical protein JO161_07995 [Planctomycetaceae bacterium]|nr:hypothetical protein [Planctomycetaceae bacterium]
MPIPLELQPERSWALGAPVLVVVLAIFISTMVLWLLEPCPSAVPLAQASDHRANLFQVPKFVAVPRESRKQARSPCYRLHRRDVVDAE